MPKRRVLFDAGPMLGDQKTGVGYYVSHLMTSLQQAQPETLELTGYYFNFLNRHGDKTGGSSGLHFHKIRFTPGKLLSACRRLGFQPFLELFVRQKSDAVIFTNYVSLPLLQKRKTALIVYDLGFLDVPEFTQSANLAFLKRFCPSSIRRADTIITISQFTKERIEHYFPNSRANIIVTPIPPIDNAASKSPLGDSLTEKGLETRKYILYLGTIEPRKNLETLVAAYTALAPDVRKAYRLVLAGGQGWKDEKILTTVAEQQSKGENIIMTGYVSEAEKSALYSNAACFVMPSHYEGFGMPIFEAMQHDIPITVSDIPVFREVAGNAAVYFDQDNPEDMADKIAAVLSDKDLRKKTIEHGRNQLKAFSWQENAEKVYRALS